MMAHATPTVVFARMADSITPPPTRPTTRGPAPKPAADPTPSRDWAGQATDAVEAAVLAIKQKTTIPLTTVARALVYGVVIAVLGIAVVIMLTIAAVRILVVYVPVGSVHGHHRIWIIDLAVGLLFTLGGLYVWSKRAAKET